MFFLSDTCDNEFHSPWRSRAIFVPPLPANRDHQDPTDCGPHDLAPVCWTCIFWVQTKKTITQTEQTHNKITGFQTLFPCCYFLVSSSKVFPVLFYPILSGILPRHNASLSILQQSHLHLQANVLTFLLWEGQQWWLLFNLCFVFYWCYIYFHRFIFYVGPFQCC